MRKETQFEILCRNVK